MRDWFVTRMEVENSGMTQYSDFYGHSTTFYDQLSSKRPILNIEFQHKHSRMTKSYREIPITPEIEHAFHNLNYDALSFLNDKALENGFIALEDETGSINYCNRNIQVCDKTCCLNNICELGTMRKMTQQSS